MTPAPLVPGQRLRLADAGEADDLAAFLARLIHYDRAAVVRLQAGQGVLGVFGRPPSFEVLAIRTARLAAADTLDLTVSAGQLADALDAGGTEAVLPPAVTGPPWAGVLPPRGGWRQVSGLPEPAAVRGALATAVAEFRTRDAALPEQHRTRQERDRMGREIWSRTLGGTGLPLRAVHAAQSLGFLRPAGAPEGLALFAAGGWLRLRTPYGSIAVRTGGLSGLTVTPA
ncbi:hypothetical protein [Streptomyces orinoci]|uniref:FAD-binding PCMH-type domain-containing protein n=1 Tax=Streptomyces orinoci TaxID=67339 RepID=A0ABV3JQH6_STRON|nr:hypothetical protein [Streptomyces orinoci]